MIGEIQEFAEAAKRIGYADPSDVDAYLREGANAFLAKNYAAAFQIFRALLLPAGHGEFHLGQDEMIDEVLGIDPATCAAQYVASMYMTATPKNRGKAVLSAIDEMHGIGHFWEPLRELERVAIEPLPDLDAVSETSTGAIPRSNASSADTRDAHEPARACCRAVASVIERTSAISLCASPLNTNAKDS